MHAHHQRAVEKATERLLKSDDILAVLLGGSIAKQCERVDSDVDLIAVTTDAGYQDRLGRHEVGFLWREVADYPGGYVDGRFVPRSFVLEAAERGSEPTRHSFTAVTAVHCTDPAIAEALPRIPVYPLAEQSRRMASFFAQMMLNNWFFFSEGDRRTDIYLKQRACNDIVLFGARLIIACNRRLFPCQKRLMETLESCEQKPADIIDKAKRVLIEMSKEAKDDFCQTVADFVGWPKADRLSRFLEDVETAWCSRTIPVAEW